MRFFSVLTVAATASAAAISSTTTIKRNGLDVRVNTEPKKCLCKSDVDELVEVYQKMLGDWDDSLIEYLADDFYDFSESINSLIPNGPPMGVPVFNKASFIEHQQTAPDNLPVIIERLGPWNCDSISFIWHATFKKNPTVEEQKVRGLTIISASHNEGKWQFSGFDVEFNSIQFLFATGGTITRAAPPPAAPSATVV